MGLSGSRRCIGIRFALLADRDVGATSLLSPGAGEQQNLKRPVRCRASEFIYNPLIQSMTCRLPATAVVRWPAKISRYLLLAFLASASKAYSGPRRSIGSSLPTTQSNGTGEAAAPIIAAFFGITACPSGSNQLR